MTRVAIGIPSFDMVHADFAMSLALLAHAAKDLDLVFLNGKNSIVSTARNQIVRAAQELEAEWLLFLDSDLIFPPDTLKRLLAHSHDIVGATYRRRTAPNDMLGATLRPEADDYESGLVEMSYIPTGCLLVRLSVFEKFSSPVFRFAVDEERGETIGEDYLFSTEARQHGHRLWCDIDLSKSLGHIGQVVWRSHCPPH
jgi:glycosyltransferase involved in cell wall biosynthesis